MKNRKIKNYIIYPKFQITLLLTNIVVTSITLAMIYYKVNEVFDRLRAMGEKINLVSGHPYYSFVANSQKMMNHNLSWAFGFSIFVMTVTSIYLSHKISGPIYNLKNFFINIINGKAQRDMTFRKGDYYDDLPKIINEALAKLKTNKE